MGFSHKPIISCQTSMCQWQYLYHILPQISRPHTITSGKWGQITRYGIEIRTRDHFRRLHPIEIRHIVYMTLEQSRVINYIQIKCICGEITRFTRNQIHFKLKLTTGLTKTADSHLFFCFKIFFTRNPAGHKEISFSTSKKGWVLTIMSLFFTKMPGIVSFSLLYPRKKAMCWLWNRVDFKLCASVVKLLDFHVNTCLF